MLKGWPRVLLESCVSVSNGYLRNTRRFAGPHRTCPVLNGLKLREVCKLSGSPDAEHRTVRCSPDSNPERFAKCPVHQTLSTGLTPVRLVHTASSGQVHRTLKTSVWCLRAVHPVSVSQRKILPRLLQISYRRNRKYTLNFLKSAESRLASSAGGREEPTPLSTLGNPPPLQMC